MYAIIMAMKKNILILIASLIVVLLAYSYISNKNESAKNTTRLSGIRTEQETSSTSVENMMQTSVETTNGTTNGLANLQAQTTLTKDKKNMNVTFKTNKGNIVIELFDSKVPNTTANFRKLAESGFYDGVKFHRVIKGFMIQSGDPFTKDDSKQALWGQGGPDYTFDDEITPSNRNDVGTISMANRGPNTNGSQFFINTNDNNLSLNSKHTVFGKVVGGMDIVTAIENSKTDAYDRPVTPIIIEKVSF